MRVRLVALSVVLATAVAGLAYARARDDGTSARAAASGASLRLGVVANTLGWGRDVGRAQAVAQRAGAGWLREEIQWARVAPRRGERRWAATDRMFVAAAHRRLRVLPLLNEAPRWARGRDHALPTDHAAYARFVADAVARYGPSGSFWRTHPTLDRALAPTWFELWNEPYFARPSHGEVTAARYAALAASALQAGRAADPRARFLLAVDVSTAAEPHLDERWLERLAAARPGLLNSVDGVTSHPYAADGAASLRSLDHLRSALAARGQPRLPIWVTEVGWTTCARGSLCVTERQQADDLRRFLSGVRAGDRADAVFYYHLRSWRVRVGEQFYGDFGLLRANLTRKPAWSVFRQFANGLKRGGAG